MPTITPPKAFLLDSEPLEGIDKHKYTGSKFIENGQGTE